jgi:hypothetical protein
VFEKKKTDRWTGVYLQTPRNFRIAKMTFWSFSVLEWIATVMLSLIALKFTWNVCHFVFTTFLGSWLKLNLNLMDYGPWAG